jgi:hypothetical protein
MIAKETLQGLLMAKSDKEVVGCVYFGSSRQKMTVTGNHPASLALGQEIFFHRGAARIDFHVRCFVTVLMRSASPDRKPCLIC